MQTFLFSKTSKKSFSKNKKNRELGEFSKFKNTEVYIPTEIAIFVLL